MKKNLLLYSVFFVLLLMHVALAGGRGGWTGCDPDGDGIDIFGFNKNANEYISPYYDSGDWPYVYAMITNQNNFVAACDFDADGKISVAEYQDIITDSDGDFLMDVEEKYLYGSDKGSFDTDNGGFGDGKEIKILYSEPLDYDPSIIDGDELI